MKVPKIAGTVGKAHPDWRRLRHPLTVHVVSLSGTGVRIHGRQSIDSNRWEGNPLDSVRTMATL